MVFRYLHDNPNGSFRDIAGHHQRPRQRGRVSMPHPEHAVEPLTGPSLDGLGFFSSVISQLVDA